MHHVRACVPCAPRACPPCARTSGFRSVCPALRTPACPSCAPACWACGAANSPGCLRSSTSSTSRGCAGRCFVRQRRRHRGGAPAGALFWCCACVCALALPVLALRAPAARARAVRARVVCFRAGCVVCLFSSHDGARSSMSPTHHIPRRPDMPLPLRIALACPYACARHAVLRAPTCTQMFTVCGWPCPCALSCIWKCRSCLCFPPALSLVTSCPPGRDLITPCEAELARTLSPS